MSWTWNTWPHCGTQAGWTHDPRTFRWVLHDDRGTIRGSITDEQVAVMAGFRDAQRIVMRSFVVPLPVLPPPD